MKIQKEELVLVPIREMAHCEKCGAELGEAVPHPDYGRLTPDGMGHFVPIHKRRYSYACPQCGTIEESDEEFPRIIYEHRTKEGEIIDEKR